MIERNRNGKNILRYDTISFISQLPFLSSFNSIFISLVDLFLLGNLPLDITEKEIDDLFYKYGDIKDIEIKQPANPPAYAFITFYDRRDAEDAVDRRNGYKFDGAPLRCEIARDYRRFERRGPPRDGGPRNTSEYRVIIKGLSSRTSWQDLKDFMRDKNTGDVLYTNVDRKGGGIVDFGNREDMEYAIRKLDDTELDGNRIELSAENKDSFGGGSSSSNGGRRRSRSRDRSPSRSEGK